jgi:P4 family phage/plasmid primase-like protien
MITPESLVNLGIEVFQCGANKRPIVENGGGFKSASLVLPKPWLGTLIGVAIPDGCVIIDLDTEKGITKEACDSHFGCQLNWDDACLQKTPSGGGHYAFKIPLGTDIAQNVNWFKDVLPNGFDTRCHNKGYICTGGPYRQSGSVGIFKLGFVETLPELPARVIDLLKVVEVEIEQTLPTGHRDIEEVQKVLSYIPSDCDYKTWLHTAMGLKHYFHDDIATAEALFHNWSKTYVKYSYKEAHDIFHSFQAVGPDRSITIASVVAEAKKAGYLPPRTDYGLLLSENRISNHDFEDLVKRINQDAGTPGKLELITEEIASLDMNNIQREDLVSIIMRVRKDHGLPMAKKTVSDACKPKEFLNTTIIPVPENIDFLDLNVPEISGLSSNSGISAGLIMDTLFKGRFVRDFGTYWWTGKKFEPLSKEWVVDMTSNAYGRGEYAKRANVVGTAAALMSNAPLVKDLGQSDHRLFFQNCVYDPLTGQLTSHDRSNKNISLLNVNYNPAADCPTWDSFVASIFEHEPECIDLLHEMMGWCLCSSHFGIEKALLLEGASRGGKGVIIVALESIIGSAAAPFKIDQLADNKTLSSFRKVNVAIDSDAASPSRNTATTVQSNFLSISANEPISIPLLHTQEPWKGRLNCKLLLACNSIPMLYDDSGAAPKRWVPLKFVKSHLGKEDYGLKPKMVEEREGITNRFLDGLHRLLRNGGKFTMPKSSQETLDNLAMSSSPIVQFFNECLNFDPGLVEHSSTMYQAYTQWAHQVGNYRLQKTKFMDAMRLAGIPRGIEYHKAIRDEAGRVSTGFKGVGLKSDSINKIVELLKCN